MGGRSQAVVWLICLTMVFLTFIRAEISYGQYGSCCIDQDPPVKKVVKLMIQAKTRTVTQQQRVARKCGVFGWDVCTSYTTVQMPQQYYVQLYTHETTYPPCKKYGCCKGFQELLDKCIELDNLKKFIGLVADLKEKNPDSDIKDALNQVLLKEGILG